MTAQGLTRRRDSRGRYASLNVFPAQLGASWKPSTSRHYLPVRQQAPRSFAEFAGS